MPAPGTAQETVSSSGPVPPSRRLGGDPWWLLALVLLAGGVLFHAARAVTGGWIPAADDGFWALMSRAVFSSHPPLLGSSSSGGLTSGTGFHHLGPLGFYLLAPFVAVLGGVGVAVGAAVLNATCAVLAAVSVRAAAGRRAGWVVLAGSALLAYVMGSELLVDPWNPHLATFPLWFGLCGAWAVLRGRPGWAAATLLALSLSMQTHLSFVPVGAVAAAGALAATVWWCRRDADRGRRAWAPLWWALVTVAVANLPVLVQQFLGAGRGNVGAILAGSTDQGAGIGVGAGFGLMSQPLLQPWNWRPGAWRHHVVGAWELASPWVLVAVAVALLALLVRSMQREAHATRNDLLLALVLLAVGAGVAGTLPHRIFGVPMSLARWVWPLGLFVQVVAVVAALDLFRPGRVDPQPSGPPARPVAAVLGCALVALLVGANLPARDEGAGGSARSRDEINEVIDAAAPELDRLEHPFVPIPPTLLGNDTAIALLDWFDDRGIPFSLDDPVALRQAGQHRRVDGSETATVLVRGGAQVLDPLPDGFRTVGRVDGVTAEDARWHRERSEQVDARLDGFRERLRSEEFRAEVGHPPGVNAGAADYSRYELLCMDQTALPLGVAVTQAELIPDAERARLCRIEDALTFGTVSISIGPPPD